MDCSAQHEGFLYSIHVRSLDEGLTDRTRAFVHIEKKNLSSNQPQTTKLRHSYYHFLPDQFETNFSLIQSRTSDEFIKLEAHIQDRSIEQASMRIFDQGWRQIPLQCELRASPDPSFEIK